MKRVTKSTYKLALGETLRLLKKNPKLLSYCRFVALLGSVREGEQISGYSDLDILFILKNNDNEVLNHKMLSNLRSLCQILSRKYPIKISFLTHTEKEFKEYVEYEYLVHYSWGKVFIGRQSEFTSFFDKFISQKKPNKKELARQMYVAIVHANFNLVRKYVSFNIFNTKNYQKELLKLFIDNLLEIADWRLIADDIWCSSKKEIVQKTMNISKGLYRGVVGEAYKYRKNWNNKVPKGVVIDRFFTKSINFINDCAVELKSRI